MLYAGNPLTRVRLSKDSQSEYRLQPTFIVRFTVKPATLG